MKRLILSALILAATSAHSETMSPAGCRLLAESAEITFEMVTAATAQMKSDKMAAAVPVMPMESQRAAEDMIKAQKDVLVPLLRYADSISAFAKEMRRCAG